METYRCFGFWTLFWMAVVIWIALSYLNNQPVSSTVLLVFGLVLALRVMYCLVQAASWAQVMADEVRAGKPE